jgi:hypothetical protein
MQNAPSLIGFVHLRHALGKYQVKVIGAFFVEVVLLIFFFFIRVHSII